MPFKSKSQLQTCYKKHDSNWNCDQWLKETPSVCCLPYKKIKGQHKTRCIRKGERIIGPVQTGPRGGRFFTITEGGNCSTKVYVHR